ncbi:beta-ketoacyl synthase N-terminal-like domain-containing protein [Massilia sp. W12]|uniref:beta-ketoacyl synthase N-terminal-like domain-containing protein n=1 Tax=Massilia sp. W12 TaxID=3126507 RepID=UPI0030CB741C
MKVNTSRTGLEIAVIGMAGAFPGAADIPAFWQNLLAGQSGLSTLSHDELLQAGVHPELLKRNNFVPTKGVFPNLEFFDHSFFEYTRADAAMLDPQMRALHQCVYHALEDGGYSAKPGNTGLFIGSSNNFTWELDTILQCAEGSASQFAAIQLNDKDFLATRIAYKLNLTGPAITLHCACSTSLYAIDLAVRQLLTGACRMAIAAGSGLTLPYKNGYVYEQGMILSPDGVCRPFSDDANGTVEGNGMVAVLLKPLEDALEDRDRILAVIRGSGANNDGARKVGYTAPSVEGQAEVIRRAIKMAEVEAESISYVEAHGTATALGDPVEIEGLKKAFRSKQTGFCGIGALKASIGHLDAAAGIAGFAKVVLALHHRYLPASLNFHDYNPQIDFANSPFYLVREGQAWRRPQSDDGEWPLRAGVSSFGVGGTNVHVLLEEAPALPAPDPAPGWHTLCLSAHDEEGMQRLQRQLLSWLEGQSTLPAAADFAYTMNTRRRLRLRASVAFSDCAELLPALRHACSLLPPEAEAPPLHAQIRSQPIAASQAPLRCALLFSGQGTQYPGMARTLSANLPAFKQEVENCLQICATLGRPELRGLLLEENDAQAQELIERTEFAQAALFIVEYASARVLQSLGLEIAAMLGHSLGEYVAACIAGVFSLEQGLQLVIARGRLMQSMPQGGMLAVSAAADTLRALLPPGVDLAAENGPQACTVAGPHAALESCAAQLQAAGIQCKPLHTSHAFHSAMMEPMLEEFRALLNSIPLKAPQLPYLSNVSGDWITPEQAQDPDYYCRHLRGTVRFAAGAQVLLADEQLAMVEAGPGAVLCSLMRQNTPAGRQARCVALHPGPKSPLSDAQFFARALGEIWAQGLHFEWKTWYANQKRQRLTLPLYPFAPTRFPVGRGNIYTLLEKHSGAGSAPKSAPAAASFSAACPTWQNAAQPFAEDNLGVRPCLGFSEHKALHAGLGKVKGLRLDWVRPGPAFRAFGAGLHQADLSRATDYRRLLRHLKQVDGVPELVVWLAPDLKPSGALEAFTDRVQRMLNGLRAECPQQMFKCVLFIPLEQADESASLYLDGWLRRMRVACPACDLRAVLPGRALLRAKALPQLAQIMEDELNDHARDVLLAAHDGAVRRLFQLLPQHLPQGAARSLHGKTLGLMLPLPVRQDGSAAELEKRQRSHATLHSLAQQISAACGATVHPMPAELILPHRSPSALALDGAALRNFLQPYLERDLSQYGLHDYSRAHNLVDEACGILVAQFVHQHGLPLLPGNKFSRQDLAQALGVTERMQKYVDYFLAILSQDGILQHDGEHYRVLRGIEALRPYQTVYQEVVAESPMFPGNLRLVEHCVRHYKEALREEISPISVLYPDGSNSMLIQASQGSIQELEEAVVRVVFEDWIRQILDAAGGRPLRILEAGGGFGLTMRRIAPMMRGRQVEYYFTDIGKTFLHEAREFALEQDIDFLTFGNFDITRDPAEQGLELHSFDLVFAFNVVHATRDLDVTVPNLHRLLKDGGLLCLLERTVMRRYADLVWGLADGWWHFEDAERTLSPLIGLDQWERVARRAGFTDVLVYPPRELQRARQETGIIIAQSVHNPARESAHIEGEWRLPAPPQPLDGLLLLEQPPFDGELRFEAFGDKLLDGQQAHDWLPGWRAALLQWVKGQSGLRFGAALAPGHSGAHSGDAIVKLRHGRALDAAMRSHLGAANWRRLWLPELPQGELLQETLDALQSGGAEVCLRPAQQALYALAKPHTVRKESAAATQLEGAQAYAQLLQQVWGQLFGLEQVRPDDDFFELGGDSLKVAQLTGELERHGIKLMSNEVFNRPTIRTLAAYLYEHRQSEHGAVRDWAGLQQHLRSVCGCESQALEVQIQGMPQQLLFVSDAAMAQESMLERELRGLRLPLHLQAHRILPLSQLAATQALLQSEPDSPWSAWQLQEEAAADFLPAQIALVQRAMREMNRQICSAPIAARYPMSPFQKMFLKEDNRFAFYLIDFNEELQVDLLRRAFTDIVRVQGLLRSTPRHSLLSAQWEEHAAPQALLPLPLIDLSGFTPPAQLRLCEALMQAENQVDLDVGGGVMFRVSLLRFDRRRHTLLFNLDHSIFDNMSGQVLRRQLLNRYRVLLSGSQAEMEEVKSFRHYLDQLNRGPQGISKEQLIDLFELKEYERVKHVVEARIAANRQPRVAKMRYTLDLAQYRLANDDDAAWELTLMLLCCALGQYLEIDSVPLKLLYQGRQYQDLSYFDTMGLFIDVLPLLVKVTPEDPARMLDGIQRKVRCVNRYNVSFMNMLLNWKMRMQWWDVLKTQDPKKLHRTDPMILLNYVGKAEEEYQKIVEFSSRQIEETEKKTGYASLYAVVSVVERNIHFDIFCSFEPDMQKLWRVFDEQAHKLLPQQDFQAAAPAAPAAAATAHNTPLPAAETLEACK